ncbi:MAG TPA: GNAT family N-acetyltransferase [Tepidisphaeraceae bacterium]|jgi:RimJ/RimL family protein N-acetyltransferase
MNLQTDRLLLRPYDPDDDDDVAAAYAMYSDPDVVRYLSGIVVPDFETQRERLRERNAFYATLNNQTGSWAMAERASNRVVGTGLLKQLPRSVPEFIAGIGPSIGFQPTTNPADLTDDYEVGWHLARAHWGHGYATEAARALLDYGFTRLSLPVICAVVNPANVNSIRVTRRLGMSPIGRTRKYYNAEVELFQVGPSAH